jgi:ribosomal protein L28
VLETVETKPTTVSNAKSVNSGNKHKQTPNSHSNTFLSTESSSKCFLCNSDSHYIFKCNDFLKLTVSGRFKEVKRLKLCTNCLRPNHFVRECTAGKCRFCNYKHNSLLHADSPDSVNTNPKSVLSSPADDKKNKTKAQAQ